MNGFVAGNFRISKPKTGNQQDGGQFASAAHFATQGSDFKRQSGARIRTTGTKLPRENSIHQGTIVCVKEYGAFVQLGKGDKYKDGFLHIGCLPHPPGVERVEVVETVIKENDKIWVKAVDIDEENGKYALDMRYLRQTDGKDLDPFNGRGRLVDTGWVFPKLQLKHVGQPAATNDKFGKGFVWGDIKGDQKQSSADTENLAKRPRLASSSSDSEGEANVDPKMKKKLEKQKKKLEKMRKKAEKAKQKLQKKDRDKDKNKKKKKDDKNSSASSSGS
eukprot:TRINITY_DN24046_c0_g1_i1.p1 TRINITY_DN24046_c0_g1~~TRINITY_DN24046_c0_g1_i1.p1  ORF type:complete len:276 (-),score=67.10 TRINITY_DN24046_c0_g1_i1:19-846(-)